MNEDEQSKENRYIVMGLIALALFAALFIAVAVGLGEWTEMPRR